jgi:hypothetical protein
VAASIQLYDHTPSKLLDGSFAVGDSYIINLYSTLPFNASATTKAAAESGATQVSTANGYTQNTKALTGVAVSVVTTNDAKFDADDVTWSATGSGITASFALCYNDTDTNDPPVFRIDFDGSQTAGAGTDFKIIWNASGIITATYT